MQNVIKENMVSVYVKDLDNKLFVAKEEHLKHSLDFFDIDVQLAAYNIPRYKKSLTAMNHSEPTYEHVTRGDIVFIKYHTSEDQDMFLIYIPQNLSETQEAITRDALISMEGLEVYLSKLGEDNEYKDVDPNVYVQNMVKFKPRTLQMSDKRTKK